VNDLEGWAYPGQQFRRGREAFSASFRRGGTPYGGPEALELPISVFLKNEDQYRCFSRSGVNPKKMAALVVRQLALGIFLRPSVLSAEKLIFASLPLLNLGACRLGRRREQPRHYDHDNQDIVSAHNSLLQAIIAKRPFLGL
jgi:hypothetical protein